MKRGQIFNSVQVKKPGRNLFDLTHDVKLSCNMGDLIPTLALECIPGDKFNIGCDSLVRLAPLVSPVMHRLDTRMEYYFVPNRLVWENWEDFITPGKVSVLPAFPVWTVNPIDIPGTYSKLLNYFGIPIPDPGGQPEEISAIPLAAYQLICNEFYRAQQLEPEIVYQLTDGDNSAQTSLFEMRKRGWMHDYYTSALPNPQMGAAVDIPLGDVTMKDIGDISEPGEFRNVGTGNPGQGAVTGEAITGDLLVNTLDSVYDPKGSLEVEATTISTLRRAFKLQEWLERAARGGQRYVEAIWSFFNVKSPDSRLQRPEFITAVKSPVQISEVLNTTGTDDLPQGNMAGHGISVISGDKYGSYYCQEHGFIIGIMSIIPVTAYQQGIPKAFLKTADPYQYYWEQFAHIGEQEIYNKELFAYASDGSQVFGYTPRYVEYKYMPSRVCGQFQTTLDFWHLGRIFTTTPNLNADFIHVDSATTDRIFAVTDPAEDKLYCHVLHKISASRQMPVFGSPAI